MTHAQFEALIDDGGLEVQFMIRLMFQDLKNKLLLKDDTAVIMGVRK